MLTDEKIIKKLNSLHEHKMAKDIFVPVFKKMGLKGVRYTGGAGEEGIDVEYYEIMNPDKIKSYVGVQFKKGNLVYGAGGTKNTIKEIKNQAEEAFEKEIHDLEDGNTYYISRFIAATTGIINENARKYIGRARQKNKDRQISYWEITVLIEYIRNYWIDEFIEYFKIENIETDNNEKIESNIVNSDYIEENYSDSVEIVKKVSQIVSSFEWEILRTVAILHFNNGASVSMGDLLFELGRTEDYCTEEFKQLCFLDLLEIEPDGVYLHGHSSEIETLLNSIQNELEDAEETEVDAEQIFEEIIN